jgi:hypothetical protein
MFVIFYSKKTYCNLNSSTLNLGITKNTQKSFFETMWEACKKEGGQQKTVLCEEAFL